MIKIIAEIGINHNGNINTCKKLIDLAKVAGFDFVKFQKRDIDIAVPEHKKNEPKSTPWGEMTYYEYKKKIEFNEEAYNWIDRYCYYMGMKWFASAWDIPSLIFMANYSNIVKIPSALITDTAYLRTARELFDFVIMSTGMSTEEQIEQAVLACKPDVIMHTSSAYPSPVEDLNLEYIPWLKNKYQGCQIGYSGHEYGLTTTFSAISMGIEWVERHITLDHDMWGSDQKASVDPIGCIKLVRGIRDIEAALKGNGPREILESEKSKLKDLRK